MKNIKKMLLSAFALTVLLGCQLVSNTIQSDRSEPEISVNTSIPDATTIESTKAPTNTSIPESTATSVPRSGDLIYETTFQYINDWSIITLTNKAGYKNEPRSDGLYVEVPDDNDYWIAYYEHLGKNISSDVRLEADVELVGGTNYTYISLICRSSNEGEYVFFLDTGGYWQIGKYIFGENSTFEELDYGGSNKIKVGKDANHITAVCEGDELTFFINDQKVSSIQDSQFSQGEIGIGVETLDLPLAQVVLHKFSAYVP